MTNFDHYDRIASLGHDSILKTTGQVEIKVTDQAGISRFYILEPGVEVRVLETRPEVLFCIAAIGKRKIRRGYIEPEHWHRLELVEKSIDWERDDR